MSCGGKRIISLCADRIVKEILGPNGAAVTRMENIECNTKCSNSYAGHGIIILR